MSLLQQFRLDNKVALITGASKGIGRAIALAFAEAGAKLVLAARDEEPLQLLANDIRAQGGKVECIKTNCKSEKQLAHLVEKTIALFGQVDVLVNNAGGALPNNPLETSAEQFNNDYHFNVTAPFVLARLCIPHMPENSAIINISSSSARYSQKGFTSYGSAKAALNQLTRLLAAECAPRIRVNAIEPGTIYTEALAQFLDEAATQRMIDKTPLKRLGEPQDIAAAALYLASPAARWVTGKILEVDGGSEQSTWPF